MELSEICLTLKRLASRYPEPLREDQLRDVSRIAFHIKLVIDETGHLSPAKLEIADLGGGIGLFSLGCAALGFKRIVLVDDFDDEVNHSVGDSILELHRSLGVEVVNRDVVDRGIEDIPGGFDVVTTFDSMEHWHHSPKRLFHSVMGKLKHGGVFVIGVPNAVNLRKRISVPLGYSNWSAMRDWYEAPLFRGHVREPVVDDLSYIARDLGLEGSRILGRNWLGYASRSQHIRALTKIVDPVLRWFPQLCSDIYLVGKKA
jgi:SAM-dependent methyltransferase